MSNKALSESKEIPIIGEYKQIGIDVYCWTGENWMLCGRNSTPFLMAIFDYGWTEKETMAQARFRNPTDPFFYIQQQFKIAGLK